MDSLIRLNQLNLSELSGYIASVFSSFPQQNISGNLTPSGSGVYSLGSSTNYYKNVYVNGISVPFGSGITIGNTFFTAYSSGGAGIVQVGDYQITSSGNFISIQGPQGIQGPTGAIGPIGPTGIGITGSSYNQQNYTLSLKLSNGQDTQVFISPLSGASGVSITGFFQSGNFIYPQFDNSRGTGSPIRLVSGPQGEQGLPGTVILNFNSGLSEFAGKLSDLNFPSSVQILDYYDSVSYPPISLMRGMSYTLDFSGLNTHIITEEDYQFITGLLNNPSTPLSKVGENSNYYSDPVNGTGYWRMVFFDSEIPNQIKSGEYLSQQDFYNDLLVKNEEVYGDSSYTDSYRSRITFNTKYTAKNKYKYGFVVYSIGEYEDEVLTNNLLEGAKSIAVIFGDVFISSGVGPQGPAGPQGPIGPPGTGVGPKGDDGVGIESVNVEEFQIQFVYQDGRTSQLIDLPQGGPAGPSGQNGLPGSLTNYFSGTYSNTNIYKQNDTVSRNGSTYIYINSIPTGGKAPEDYIDSFWQLLAKSGEKGEKGERGFSGIADRYSSSFFVKSGNPTGVLNFLNGSTGITVNGINLSGTGAKFKNGDNVSFVNSGIIGYSYTPFQNVVFSSNSVSNSYFFGRINSYNSNNGIISFYVESGGTGIINTTISGDYFLWYNYNNSTLNLGANLMSGAKGEIGPIGPQGLPGQPSLLRNSEIIYLNYDTGEFYTADPSELDVFNITITGKGDNVGVDRTYISFNWNNFQIGKCVLLRIKNSGISDGNFEPPLFYFSGDDTNNIIKWPNDIYTRPNHGETYIYSILRFADENGKKSCFGTYSNPYTY